ncbi:MAG TPA: hypothetical protein VJN18_06155 [Polyangiaceae bacterium]|nr:hypothetical protein [Polyangiaceae bacterium]
MLGLGNLGRRLLEGAVGLFALLGFLYVPLGRQTGFEHARAVLSTPAASAAIEDLTTSALRLRQRAIDFVTGRVSPPAPPAEGKVDHGADRQQPHRGGALAPPISATPPKLK